MIDIIVSTSLCPHCDAQKSVMQKSFFPNEYRVIALGSAEFEAYDLKEQVDAVPFIVVRDDENGQVKYANKGKLDGTSLRQIERVGSAGRVGALIPEKTFNLKENRSLHVSGRLSRYMDA